MPVRLRLQRHGRKKRPFYFIVAADSRSPRDGAFIERIGDYNPLTTPATIHLDIDKAFVWVMQGAQPTNTVKKILTYQGILFKKHLFRGVKKGAFSMEVAEKKWEEWLEDKQKRTQDRLTHEANKRSEARRKRDQSEIEKRETRVSARVAAAQQSNEPVSDSEPAESAPEETSEAAE